MAVAPASARAAQPAGSAPSAHTLRATLPLVTVDTRRRIPDEPKLRGTLRIVDNGRGRNRVRDRPVFRGRMGIEVRGYSSQQLFPKKQYALELRGGDAPLLGLPADDDWVLAAPYNDKSLIRNVLAYRARDRPLRPAHPVRRARAQRRLRDPNRDELSAREAGWIRGYVARFERALYRGGGDWRRYLDVPAAVDYVLLQELFKNEDGFYSSTYTHKGRGAKLAMGPVWEGLRRRHGQLDPRPQPPPDGPDAARPAPGPSGSTASQRSLIRWHAGGVSCAAPDCAAT